MSYSRSSILSTRFLFISHQSDQQFLRYSYFEILPWNIQGQGHEWGQRSKSHIIHSIKPMNFLFVSHQSDQSFLRYGQNSVEHWKNISEIFKEICQNNSFQQKCSHQVINMTRTMKLPCFVVIWWVFLTLSRRQANLCQSMSQQTLGQGHGNVIQYISPDPYDLCAKYLRFSWNGLDVRGKSFCGGGRGGGGGGRGDGRGGNELKT